MTPQAVLFLVLPGASAILVGWAVRRRAVAGAVAVLGLAGLVAISEAAVPDARALTPVVTGAGLSGLVLVAVLSARPSAPTRPRLLATLLTVPGAHGVYLYLAMAGR
jgi:hypothetical protein